MVAIISVYQFANLKNRELVTAFTLRVVVNDAPWRAVEGLPMVDPDPHYYSALVSGLSDLRGKSTYIVYPNTYEESLVWL